MPVSIDSPSAPTFKQSVGNYLIDSIMVIDRQCDAKYEGMEGGLAYVKTQFAERARADTGRKLTEETVTTWLIAQRLGHSGIAFSMEQPYPSGKSKCDLVLSFGSDRFWIENKFAWKHWFRCDGTAHSSSAFKGYLLGDASHKGAAYDFRKLEPLAPPAARWVGVLLVGFDKNGAEMAPDVRQLEVQGELLDHGWNRVCERRWTDRRNPEFAIACWFWARECGQTSHR